MPDIQRLLTASGLVHTGPGLLTGLVACVSHGSANSTITFYDNTAGSGAKILELEIEMDAQPYNLFFTDRFAPRFTTGLYVVMDADTALNVWAAGR
jgi:hypothetical protein